MTLIDAFSDLLLFVDAEPNVAGEFVACLIVVDVVQLVVVGLFLLDVVDAKVDVKENVLDEF